MGLGFVCSNDPAAGLVLSLMMTPKHSPHLYWFTHFPNRAVVPKFFHNFYIWVIFLTEGGAVGGKSQVS